MSVNNPNLYVPRWDDGSTFDQPGQDAIYGYDLAEGGNCIICGSAVYCGGPQCPNGVTLPLAPDQVPMVQEQYQSVEVWNAQAGQTSGDGAATVAQFVTQVA